MAQKSMHAFYGEQASIAQLNFTLNLVVIGDFWGFSFKISVIIAQVEVWVSVGCELTINFGRCLSSKSCLSSTNTKLLELSSRANARSQSNELSSIRWPRWGTREKYRPTAGKNFSFISIDRQLLPHRDEENKAGLYPGCWICALWIGSLVALIARAWWMN